jgi:hypothetical protein
MDGGELRSEPAQIPDDLMPVQPGMSPEEVRARQTARLAAPRDRLRAGKIRVIWRKLDCLNPSLQKG